MSQAQGSFPSCRSAVVQVFPPSTDTSNPFDGALPAGYRVSSYRDRPRRHRFFVRWLADDGIHRQFPQHQAFSPVGSLFIDLRREDLVGVGLVVVGRGLLLEFDAGQPLDAARPNVPGRHHPQRRAVLGCEGFSVHLVGQHELRSHRQGYGTGAPKSEPLVFHLDLV